MTTVLVLELDDVLAEALREIADDQGRSFEDLAIHALRCHAWGRYGPGRSDIGGPVVQIRKGRRIAVTRPVRKLVFDRSGGVCHYCRAEIHPLGDWHVDHAEPLSLGGSNDDDNLVAACAPCNLKKGAKTALDFAARTKAVN